MFVAKGAPTMHATQTPRWCNSPPQQHRATPKRGTRTRRTLQIALGIASLFAAVFLWMGTTAAVPSHPGGTDENGCHAGSEPYHCHLGSDPATATGAGTGTPTAPVPPPPVVEAPPAGAPDAAVPPELTQPSEPPAQAAPVVPPGPPNQSGAPATPDAPPAEVQGIQETRQPTDALAQTGITEDTYYLAVGLLLAGILLLTTSGLVGGLPERTRGGFTYSTKSRSGAPVVVRVTTRRA